MHRAISNLHLFARENPPPFFNFLFTVDRTKKKKMSQAAPVFPTPPPTSPQRHHRMTGRTTRARKSAHVPHIVLQECVPPCPAASAHAMIFVFFSFTSSSIPQPSVAVTHKQRNHWLRTLLKRVGTLAGISTTTRARRKCSSTISGSCSTARLDIRVCAGRASITHKQEQDCKKFSQTQAQDAGESGLHIT